MSDPNTPGDVPPDLPPEYAEAYRRGYERALARSGDDETESPEPASTQATAEFQPLFAGELLGQQNVKNYDGSWTEYGSLVGVPVALGDEAGVA